MTGTGIRAFIGTISPTLDLWGLHNNKVITTIWYELLCESEYPNTLNRVIILSKTTGDAKWTGMYLQKR